MRISPARRGVIYEKFSIKELFIGPFALFVGQLAYEGNGSPKLPSRFERFGRRESFKEVCEPVWLTRGIHDRLGDNMSELVIWDSFYIIGRKFLTAIVFNRRVVVPWCA